MKFKVGQKIVSTWDPHHYGRILAVRKDCYLIEWDHEGVAQQTRSYIEDSFESSTNGIDRVLDDLDDL